MRRTICLKAFYSFMKWPVFFIALVVSQAVGLAQGSFSTDFRQNQDFTLGPGATGWFGADGGNNPDTTFALSSGQLSVLPQTSEFGLWGAAYPGNTPAAVFNSFGVTSVPKPGDVALMGAGILGLLAVCRTGLKIVGVLRSL